MSPHTFFFQNFEGEILFSMKQNIFKFVLLAVGLILFAVTLYIYSPNRTKYTRVTVAANAQTKTTPDTALITFSVVTQNKDALAAQQENAKRSEAVKTAVEALTRNAQAKIKTSNYNLAPDYDYSGAQTKISGYDVTNSVTISIKDLNLVGAVIDAATKAGANGVEGVRFVIGDNSPKQGDALALVTAQAMAKAEAIAKSLNGKIIRVVETHEGGVPILPPSGSEYAANAMASNATAAKPSYATSLQSGSIEMRSNVILVVEVEM